MTDVAMRCRCAAPAATQEPAPSAGGAREASRKHQRASKLEPNSSAAMRTGKRVSGV